jgi:hypothetical protein
VKDVGFRRQVVDDLLMNWFPYLLLSVASSFGLAVALVEKKRSWPVRRYHLILLNLLNKVHPRLRRMLNCAPCTSFWCSLVVDCLILVVSGGSYWAWPLSGFITFGVTWLIMDWLNTLDRLGSKIERSISEVGEKLESLRDKAE